MNAVVTRMSAEALKRGVIEFTRAASTEVSTHDEGLLPTLATKLPAGTTIYVGHTPRASLDDVVRVAIKIEAFGFPASPHIVARRLESECALKTALHELRDGGVEQLLLVAGDCEHPVGSFSSTLEVLDTGQIIEAGFKKVGVCGHPEGHNAIGTTALWNALRLKQAIAERTGLKMHIVSQFGFNPEAVCVWDRQLVEHGISLPVHVGIAGPTPLVKLIKFAMQCGVGTSLHSLMKRMTSMSKLVRLVTSPDEMLVELLRGRAAHGGSRLVQPHFYSFGGAVATAHWLRAVVDGTFEMPRDGGKFVMNA